MRQMIKLNGFDPYKYPGTDILINLKGIKNQEDLDSYERLSCSIKLAELYKYEILPIDINYLFDKNHFLNIHEYLFEDIYPFAGKIRNVDTVKGRIKYCKAMFVEEHLDKILLEMKKSLFSVKNYEELIDRIAYYYSEIYFIHPFREGNSRTLRKFIREYVMALNHVLDIGEYEVEYRNIGREELYDATVESVFTDYSWLKEIFRKGIIKSQKQIIK